MLYVTVFPIYQHYDEDESISAHLQHTMNSLEFNINKLQTERSILFTQNTANVCIVYLLRALYVLRFL